MKPYLFNIILGFLALIVLLLPFTGKVHDGRFRWFRGFTIKGWIVLTAFIASIAVNYFKDQQADKDDSEKLRLAKTEKRQDDSISRKRNDESNAKIVITFTEALAKHGLKYDSAEKAIQKLVQDSSKKNTIIVASVKPDIDINEVKYIAYRNDSLIFSFQLVCKDAAAEQVNIVCQTMYLRNNSYVKIPIFKGFFPHNVKLSKNSVYSINGPVMVNIPKLDFAKIYFLITGSYNFNNQNYPIEQLIYYNFRTSESGIPGNKEEIMEYLKNN